ncbi:MULTISPECIES: TIGR00153 family protein [Photobacterium]|uniref:Phosphate transport regulator n=1 Tax=Photobacterium ganghwense TaxID=320778 RepID=A0A0J1KA84_9GAMM|nr:MULTISPECIES: TIGR00153 family protein [Photobacterium]KLV11222.1 phosphate transport regulator [Photobacterium ganghwense]MBV1842656.1 TIGR00153 family protein [Photobacterium ganghwense]PSU05152.1 TIGR00153 family protein [Photobacterium ganghwense]QSV13763.1 TIGR00153 family protein [Photobacterium ganghwense]
MPVNTIMGLFAKSPIKPLQRHVTRVNECCDLLVPFFEACKAGDWEQATVVREQISQLEKDADVLKREIRLKLPRGLFMPVDRTDMLDLLTQQDKLANLAKDIAGRVLGRQLQIPTEMYPDFLAYVQRCLDSASQANRVINELDELLETGFKGREVTLVAEMINQLDVIEDDTDSMQIRLRQQLMSIEDQHSPVDVMFLYKILEWIGAIADQAQRVGSRLEIMLSRS